MLRISVGLMLVLSEAVLAAPILKTGACPTLTRRNASSSDDWSQFPNKPNPSSTYPVGTIQDSLSPEQSINCAVVPAGLHAELVASEKLTGPAPAPAYIQNFTFDERGRLWAVEPRDYPNTINANRLTGGQGRILILEDTDGDGAYDNYKVFYTGLVIPNSIEVVNGGVIVTSTPFVYYFPNNNDVAGTAVALFSTMGTTGNFDSHGSTNSLMNGLDNWIYGHLGYNGGCSVNGVTCPTGGIWRFKHTALGAASTVFQSYSTGPANAHGIGQMEDGQLFQSGATGTSHSQHAIRRGVAAIDIRNGSPNNVYYPITGDRFLWEGSTAMTNGKFQSSTTAVSGHDFYMARLFPQKYWSRFAFTCEGASKLCNQDSLVPNNSTWKAIRLPNNANILASTDAWTAPIKAKTGPDGALYILDWYNYLFLHNPASPSGAGGAWNNALRVKHMTRIYRIVPDNTPLDPVLNLTTASTTQLVSTLSNTNFVWRLHAQRLLIKGGYTTALGTALENILKTSKAKDAVGLDPQVIHAVWVLEGLGQLASDTTRWNPIMATLLKHPSPGVRRNVLLALPRTTASGAVINTACSVNDPDPQVRIQALVAFSEITTKPSGMNPISSANSSVDSYMSSATTASGVSTGTPACTVTLDPPVNIAKPGQSKVNQPRDDLHFSMNRDGFELVPNGHLPSGELVVFDLRGQVAFRSTFNASKTEWSEKVAKGLHMPIYLYSFRGNDGTVFQGRVAISGSL